VNRGLAGQGKNRQSQQLADKTRVRVLRCWNLLGFMLDFVRALLTHMFELAVREG
jgi:hypothetical protein